jgi:hypothetical protein
MMMTFYSHVIVMGIAKKALCLYNARFGDNLNLLFKKYIAYDLISFAV